MADRPLNIPGAAVRSRMRGDELLTVGLLSSPPVLYRGSRVLLPTGDPQIDILTAPKEDPVAAGFAWPEAMERLSGALLVGSERRGRGRIILFAQDPAFRLFWRGTTPIFLNAAMFAPSLR